MKTESAKELENMRTTAWRGFVGNVRSTGRRIGRAGTQYAKTHPLLLVGGGAVLSAFLFSRIRRRPRMSAVDTFKQRLIQAGSIWLARAITVACSMAQDFGCDLEKKARR